MTSFKHSRIKPLSSLKSENTLHGTANSIIGDCICQPLTKSNCVVSDCESEERCTTLTSEALMMLHFSDFLHQGRHTGLLLWNRQYWHMLSHLTKVSIQASELASQIHMVFSNLKIWLGEIHYGLETKYLQSYLNEFVFRFNRREHPMSTFRSLLIIVVL